MRSFMDKNFLLESDTACQLYHDYAALMPIYDFHNHLDPAAINENRCFQNIGEAWLGSDHYKWRALRAAGVPEILITGTQTDFYEKFRAWAKTVPKLLGNPLYHWTHLELKRYFDIDTPLCDETADLIWHQCNERLADVNYHTQGLLKKMNVTALCTTDDPADSLENHLKIKTADNAIKVAPTFRPEKAMAVDQPGYSGYIQNLGTATQMEITTYSQLFDALKLRVDTFHTLGCRLSDHSLNADIYETATFAELDAIFEKALHHMPITPQETRQFKGNLLVALSQCYYEKGWAMQLHIGALRNNATRMFQILGPDAGFDSLDDFNYARQLSILLDTMDQNGMLPKTILYYLNPKDAEMLAAMCGNFQDGSLSGKIQLGSAWWFCDHKRGMENQLSVLQECGLLSQFVGMVTDSRSFLSFPRHEYFRRILCNHIGTIVETGQYPNDIAYLGQMVKDICFNNIKNYLN